jgi:hypothetical protein
MTEGRLFQGHDPLEKQINVKRELTRLRVDPLNEFITALRTSKPRRLMVHDDTTLYEQAYDFYVLSLSRYLPLASLAWRCRHMKWWTRENGHIVGADRRQLAKRHNKEMPYAMYEIINCLLHTRILLDRTVRLSRNFLNGGRTPSFTSFSDHKAFFRREAVVGHEAYGDYIRDKTDWFDIPIKYVRDKFFVHAGPVRGERLGYPGGDGELCLHIMVPKEPYAEKYLAQIDLYVVSIPRMMRDVDAFLHWFAAYGISATRSHLEPVSTG